MSKNIGIAFYKSSDSLREKFIKWWTGSSVVHAEILLPDKSIIGISPEDSSRVRRKMHRLGEDKWEILNLEITDEQYQLVICFFEMTHGMKYDWVGMILSHILPFYIKHDKKWYCSQWIACALTYAGIAPLFYNKINPGKLYDILKVRNCKKIKNQGCH